MDSSEGSEVEGMEVRKTPARIFAVLSPGRTQKPKEDVAAE
jgi:hypothetical protein